MLGLESCGVVRMDGSRNGEIEIMRWERVADE